MCRALHRQCNYGCSNMSFIKIINVSIVTFLVFVFIAYAGLDIYVQDYQEDNYYGKIVVANNGNEAYHDVEVKMDDKEWIFLIGKLSPGIGASWSGTITPGTHTFNVRTREGYTYSEGVNFLRKADEVVEERGSAQTLTQAQEELKKAEELRQIRDRIAAERNEKRIQEIIYGEKKPVEKIWPKILIITLIVLLVIIIGVTIYWLLRRKNENK